MTHSSMTLEEMVNRFTEAEQATIDARELAERDRDYYDGKQWTSEEKTALEKRGQAATVYNRIQRKVNYLKGLEAQTRKDPKCFPRTPGDDGAAQAATDALRYVCDDQSWDAKRSETYENICVEGTGAIFVGGRQAKGGIDPAISNIPWDRLYYDPYSRRVDFSDAAYMGIVTWMDLKEAKRKFPGKEDIITATWMQAKNSQTYDDRPKNNLWADYKRARVRVNEEYYFEGGQWISCTYTKGGFLIEPHVSEYLDVDGQPENPIKAMSAYVDRDNNRYGEVRAMISPQDEINKRRSKGLYLISSRQFRVGYNVQADVSAIKRELARPDGVVVADNGDIEVLQTGDMAAANFQMLQEAKAEIDLLGPNAALAGKNENDASGRAILAQQQGGMIEVALLMDRLRELSLAVYRSIWGRIKQYWTAERWIRVTDDERNLRWVGLNIPRTMLDIAAERLQGDPEAAQKLQLLARDPMAQMPMEMQNSIAEMDVDIIIDEGMDTPTVQAEQFDMLSKMMPAMTQLPPDAFRLLITASSLRDKDKLLEIVDKMEQQAAQPNPMMEAQQQLELQNAQAQIGKTQSETAKNYAQAQSSNPQAEAEAKRAEMMGKFALDQERQNHDMAMAQEKQQFDMAMQVQSARMKSQKAAQAA